MKKVLTLIFGYFLLCSCHAQSLEPFPLKFLTATNARQTIPLDDGKVILAGGFHFVNGVAASGLARLNANGSVDATFNVGTGPEGSISMVVRLPDGKLIVSGDFKSFNGTSRYGIVRLNADGTVDNSFNATILTTGTVGWVGVQTTGKIVIVLTKQQPGTSSFIFSVLRFNADGSADNSFTPPAFPAAGPTVYMGGIYVLPDDKVLIGGVFENFSGVTGANNLVRLNADGTFDASFAANLPAGLSNGVSTIIRYPDGKLLIRGNFAVARLNANGSADPTFAPASPLTGPVILLSDGSLVITTFYKLSKYTSAGTLISEFSFPEPGGTCLRLPNDRLLSGYMEKAQFRTHTVLHPDLTIDNSWQKIFIVSNEYSTNLLGAMPQLFKQPDGKWIVNTMADFYTPGDVTQLHFFKRVFRVNADFTFDNSFTYLPLLDDQTKVLMISAAGKIYISSFTYIDGTVALRRLNVDGSIDPGFAAVPGTFNAVAQQTAGKLIGVEWVQAISRGKLRRINDDGTPDNSLTATSVGQMRTINIQENGKYIISIDPQVISEGTSVNGTVVKQVFRMNPDGSIDTDFKFLASVSQILKVALVGGGKVMLAASISKGDGFYPIDRLSASGSQELSISEALDAKHGYDFLLKDDFIYLITYTVGNGKFELRRLLSTGVVDTRFNALNYHTRNPVSQYRVDRLHELADGSILVMGHDNAYKLKIPAVPVAPTELVATIASPTAISLAWKDNTTAELGYEIERATGGTGTFTFLASVLSNTVTYTNIGVGAGTSYAYRVVAFNAGGNSGYSNTAELTVTGVDDVATSVQVFPNPTTDDLYIQTSAETTLDCATFYDIQGRQLHLIEQPGSQLRIDLSGHPLGLYILQLEYNGKTAAFKIHKH